MNRLEAAYGRMLEAFALVACALVFGMTLMICADVLLRNVRIVPGLAGLEWSNEISEAMLYLVTMLTAPWPLRRGQHIRVDIVLRAVPKRVGWWFEWVVDLLGLACSAFIAYYGARAALAASTPGRYRSRPWSRRNGGSSACCPPRSSRFPSRCCSACGASQPPSARRATTRSAPARSCHGTRRHC